MTTSIHVHLQVYAEVVDGARTVLAPLGLPAVLKRHCPAPLLLVPMRVWDVYVVVVGRFGRSIKRGPNQSRPPPRTSYPNPNTKRSGSARRSTCCWTRPPKRRMRRCVEALSSD